ncbi:N-acetylmuramoyl-L-alanine amidase [Sedimentitalea sp. JM2-8]|uniref:N-acetylmuramoyl-L-alanine amidase n=1 Tax=Sedimentitalea xiamensis TaxID=3050037 RepID=A0ABT7FFB5_9RHOB|nr:N-acetylmuramoyl-L-alanine amidase [Sedimentitalea xiamensis]MDK3073668.1 N-acetylmuramoyl-L-alanine amidase [Sedimentitalea xiamensis]
MRWRPSPNFGPRRDGLRPELIVLHYTAMETAEAALARLCDPAAEVSAHYLIAGDGRVWQMVREEMRAWHAGAGAWRGRGDVNSRSIGIELDNRGTHPFAEPQMAALEALLPQVMARWSIGPEGVIGHSDMAPARKFDPGPRFDWSRLARRGLAVWPEAGQAGDFARDAARFGYPVEDEAALLAAFRARFRPQATGPAGAADRAMMADLAARFGVDRTGESA